MLGALRVHSSRQSANTFTVSGERVASFVDEGPEFTLVLRVVLLASQKLRTASRIAGDRPSATLTLRRSSSLTACCSIPSRSWLTIAAGSAACGGDQQHHRVPLCQPANHSAPASSRGHASRRPTPRLRRAPSWPVGEYGLELVDHQSISSASMTSGGRTGAGSARASPWRGRRGRRAPRTPPPGHHRAYSGPQPQ